MMLGPRATALGSVASLAVEWTPDELASLVFGDVAAAIVDGGRVASVGGIEQATPELRPEYLASDPAFNGQPSAVFAGAQWMAGTAAVGEASSGWSLWAVARWDSHASARTLLDVAAPSGAPFGILGLTAADAIRYGVFGYATGPVLDTSAHLVAVTLRNGSAPNFELWLDGELVASGSSSWGDPWAAGALGLGRDHTPFGWMMRGAAAAFGVVGAPMIPAEHAQQHAWASARFGTP